jgi:hypothetical protein
MKQGYLQYTLRERTRNESHESLVIQFFCFSCHLVIDLIYSTTLLINTFPPKDGISSNLSPHNLMTGITFNYNKYCQLQFGSYVQAHEETDPSPSMQAHTVGAICLGPTGNIQGSYKFLNLGSGKRITRRKWTPLPMSQEVMDRVIAWRVEI